MTIELPSIESFAAYSQKFTQIQHNHTKSTFNIDLDNFHKNLIIAKNKQQNFAMHSNVVVNPTHLLYEMFEQSFLFSFNYLIHPIIGKYIGYSKKYESLTITLFDENDRVKAIAIRRAKDADGNTIKWKTYGSKSFIPYRIDDEFIFLASGMAEFLLLEMMKVSYIVLQSDSIYKYITDEMITQAVGKNIIIFKENDASFEKLIIELGVIFKNSTIILIDFEKMLGKKLAKGFDAVDCVNKLKSISRFESILEREIINNILGKK